MGRSNGSKRRVFAVEQRPIIAVNAPCEMYAGFCDSRDLGHGTMNVYILVFAY